MRKQIKNWSDFANVIRIILRRSNNNSVNLKFHGIWSAHHRRRNFKRQTAGQALSSKSSKYLKARGLELAWCEYLGDDPARITAVLKRTFASDDVVISFGGIGATPDDHTRQCAARALGVALVLIPKRPRKSSIDLARQPIRIA